MSGGSFNFLCNQIDAGGRLYLGDLANMRDRLRELAPNSPATAATQSLYDALISVTTSGLAEVWRAVEWHDSGDYTADQVDEALTEYESKANKEVGRTVKIKLVVETDDQRFTLNREVTDVTPDGMAQAVVNLVTRAGWEAAEKFSGSYDPYYPSA